MQLYSGGLFGGGGFTVSANQLKIVFELTVLVDNVLKDSSIVRLIHLQHENLMMRPSKQRTMESILIVTFCLLQVKKKFYDKLTGVSTFR